MKLTVQIVVRSLLLGLAALFLILVPPAVVQAIASDPAALMQPATPDLPDLTPLLPELLPPNPSLLTAPQNAFSQMPGGQITRSSTLPNTAAVATATGSSRTTPRQEQVTVAATNYDRRMTTDIYGNPLHNAPIVVLHETVGSASSAINTFRRAFASDDDQVSYHSLIKRDGTIVYLVPPEMRAYGAGDSVFVGANGAETVRLDPVLPPSVNNFAYHTSLESPPDGRGNSRTHSGYTEAQYRSLTWLIAQTQVPENRITTHRAVDRSGTRRDPRSFNFQKFFADLRRYSVNEP